MRLALSKAAERDLASILRYGTEAHGWSAAEAYARELQAAMERLIDFPQLGAPRADLRPALRALPCREHLIFYRLIGETILIARILHKAMDMEGRLEP